MPLPPLMYSCCVKVWEYCDEHLSVQCCGASLLAAKLRGRFYLVSRLWESKVLVSHCHSLTSSPRQNYVSFWELDYHIHTHVHACARNRDMLCYKWSENNQNVSLLWSRVWAKITTWSPIILNTILLHCWEGPLFDTHMIYHCDIWHNTPCTIVFTKPSLSCTIQQSIFHLELATLHMLW